MISSSRGSGKSHSFRNRLPFRRTTHEVGYEQKDEGPLGLTVVHEPPEKEAIADLVFVHGLGGGSRKTWRKGDDPKLFWPQEWLPTKSGFENVRIHTFGYTSNRRTKSTPTLLDFAKDLVHSLSLTLSSVDRLPLFLVGHSMGGLIIKKAYLLALQDPEYSMIAESLKAILFFATPHRSPDLIELLSRILKITTLLQPSIQDLESNSRVIQSINEEFRASCQNLQLYSFYETQPTSLGSGRSIIVEKDAATLGTPNERTLPLFARHREMCKFTAPNDPNYITVCNALAAVLSMHPPRTQKSHKRPTAHQRLLLNANLGVSQAPEDILRAASEQRVEGSCQWLLGKDSFMDWRDNKLSDTKAFCIQGAPGSGKSVLAGFLVDHLRELNIDCSFYFFSHGDKTISSIASFLRTMAWQMADLDPSILQTVLEVGEEDDQLGMSDQRTLWRKLFLNGILKVQMEKQQYWVVDALDECADGTEIMSYLIQVLKVTSIRILFTSRPRSDLLARIVQANIAMTEMTLDPQNTQDDLAMYINSRLQYTHYLKDLAPRLLVQSGGSFLWSRLVLDQLDHAHLQQDVDNILEGIPAGMDALYSRIIQDMSAQVRNKSLVHAILVWTCCSARPLTVPELSYALELDLGIHLINTRSLIDSTCGQLIYIDKQNRVCFIHQTVRQFLLAPELNLEFSVVRREGHQRLAMTCLKYLLSSEMRVVKRRGSVWRVKQRSLFVNYASTCLHEHVLRASSTSDELTLSISRFLASPNVLSWIEYIAQESRLDILVQHGVALRIWLQRRAKYTPSPNAVIDDWAVDLVRLATKFGQQLLSHPYSIFNIVPSFCPQESAVFKQFGRSRGSIVVSGLPASGWDDRMSTITYPQERACTIACSDRYFAVGFAHGRVTVYSVRTCQEVVTLQHAGRIRVLYFGTTSSLNIFVSATARSIKVWDLATWLPRFEIPTNSSCMSLAVSQPNLLAALQNNEIITWDLQRGELTSRLDWTTRYNSDDIPRSPQHAVFYLDSNLLAVAYRGQNLLLYDFEQERVYDIFTREVDARRQNLEDRARTGNPVSVQDIAFSEGCMAILYLDGDLILFDVLDSTQLAKTTIDASVIAISPNGQFLATGNIHGTIQLFELNTLKLLYQIMTGGDSIISMVFTLDSQTLVDIRGDSCNIWQPTILLRTDADYLEADSDQVSNAPRIGELNTQLDAVLITAMYAASYEKDVFIGKDDGSVWMYKGTDPSHPQRLFYQRIDISITSIMFDHETGILTTADASSQITCRHVVNEGVTVHCGSPIFETRIDQKISQVLVNQGHTRMLVSSPTIDALYAFSVRDRDLQGSPSDNGRSLLTEPTFTIPWIGRTAYTWSSHPTMSNILVLLMENVVHLYDWDNLRRLTPEPGIAIDTTIISGVPVRAVHAHFCDRTCAVTLETTLGELSKSQVLLLKPSDMTPNSRIIDVTTNSYLSNQVEYFIGVLRDRIIFLNTSGWVCSTTAQSLTVRNHFFIPADWLNTGSKLTMKLSSEGSLVFVRHSDVLFITHGFEWEEPKFEAELPESALATGDYSVYQLSSYFEDSIDDAANGSIILERASNASNVDIYAQSDDQQTHVIDYDTTRDSISSLDSRSMSLASGRTYGTNNTHYSVEPQVSIEAELANVLSNHELFQPLYSKAMSNPDIGPDRFSGDFSRLLKAYARDLQRKAKEAKDPSKIAVAQLVHARFQFIAQSVRRRYDPNTYHKEDNMLPELKELPVQSTAEGINKFLNGTYGPRGVQGGTVGEFLPAVSTKYTGAKNYSSDIRDNLEESSSTHSDTPSELDAQVNELYRDPQNFNNWHKFKVFLTAGEPFDNLRMRLKELVEPGLDTTEPLRREEETSTANGFSTFRALMERFRKLAVRLDLLEGPPPPGYTRIEWVCACGETVCDDFLELRPGALDELKTTLASSRALYSATSGVASSSAGSRKKGYFNKIWSILSNFGVRNAQKILPTNNTSPAANTAKRTQGTTTPPTVLYLLSCLDHGNFGVKMHNELLTDVENDLSLFQFLRKTYIQQRSMRSWLSLKTIRSLNLIRFSVDMSKYVDIKWHRDNCSSQCSCLPPQRIVEPSTHPEYRCQPVPASYIPPMGKNYLMHYMRHPQLIHPQQTWVYKQLPKRLYGQLLAPNDAQVTGWGMHFQEGIDWRACGVVGFVVIVVGSCAFGIIWALVKQDVQTGFTVAAYWSNIATVVLGFYAVRVAVRVEK